MKKTTLKVLVFFMLAFAVSTASAQLVINEIDYDQPSADSSEFIELYNNSANAIDLADYTLILFNGNAVSPTWPIYDSIIFSSHLLNPGAFYVICGSSTGLIANCDTFLATSVGPGAIQNGGSTAPFCDAVALRLNSNNSIVDAVSYEGDCPPYVEGTGIPDTLSDNGITAGLSISRYPDGTDTQNNAADFYLVCSTPGAANCQPTGIKNPGNAAPSLSLFPNPATSTVNFESRGARILSVSVKNLLGKEVKSATAKTNKLQMEISSLQAGVYLVFIRTEAGETTQRLIVR